MSTDLLTKEARQENAAMLGAVLNLSAADAAGALEVTVSITADPSDAIAMQLASELVSLLSRTVERVSFNGSVDSDIVEIIVGAAKPRTVARLLFINIDNDGASIGEGVAPQACCKVPGIFLVLTACYAAAAAMQLALGGRLPYNVPEPLSIDFSALGIDPEALRSPIDLNISYLAGAGAIGNALLWAARHLDFRGQLHIVDDDHVSSGNLNRQIWFSQKEIGQPKAVCLAAKAQPFLPGIRLIARESRLQDLTEKSGGPWLKALIVAVDSRRARRKLQNEFPGEVFDASTTDIREVVIHHHKQPTTSACLSCIYEADDEEKTREQHIAEHLGVSLEEVREERISQISAARIAIKFPKLNGPALIGAAYDTLFKQLCGEGQLQTLEGRRVVAPFAFVSVLAGTLLALELVRRLGKGRSSTEFNYWRVSPWHPPLHRRQILRPRQIGCAFCGNRVLQHVNANLWG
jgi:hypothetical protein